MRTWWFPVLAGALVICAGGCGGESPADVSGSVVVDGKPLPEGEIIFEAADGSKTPVGGTVKDGHYEVKVLPGAKKVKINASRPPKKADPMFGFAPTEVMLGEEYNTKTKLTADIKPGKNEGVDFNVKALPQK
jgi:hypothetical protein